MKTQKNFTRILTAIAVWISLVAYAEAQTTSRLSTIIIARGEKAYLEVAVLGTQADEPPEIPLVKGVLVQPSGYGAQTRMVSGRKVEYVYEYLVTSYEVGKYKVPPIEVMVGGTGNITEAIEFAVFDPDELKWSSVESGGRTIRYASSFRTLNKKPFENETIPIEIKAFVPEEIFVEDWGIPAFERDGLTAWRFQPTPRLNRINLLAGRYISVSYPSTITPTRTGKIAIGPAKIRLMTREVIMDPSPSQVNRELYLDVPKLELESIPLPEGAPEGFQNAVGNFRVNASAAVTEVQEGDPISVDLMVTGSGNLDTLKPPTLADPEGWKTYGATTDQRGEERRELAGTVIFHQSIRPLEFKSEIPPFRLVYFDPQDGAYKSLSTRAIALQMTPSILSARPASGPVQSMTVPFERMTDILGVLSPAQLSVPATSTIPYWLGHLVAGFIALSLIGKALWMRYSPRLRKNANQQARLREFREMAANPSSNDIEFLKSAGAYVEHWLGGTSSPEIKAILTERDAVCFRSEKPKSALDPKRRGEILNLLRHAAMAFIIAVLSLGASARAADTFTAAMEAYDAAKYDDAIKLWLDSASYDQLSADALYNIGNACYRSGSPGHAALYYRRAILRASSHQEAQQNLRFIEQKHGAITVQRPDYQYALTKFPLATWKAVCWIGVWLCGLALLVFPATKQGAHLRGVAGVTMVFAPLLVSIGLIGWHYFPDDSKFAPLAKQAVIIGEKVTLHVDAARTAPEVIDAPPGSLCEIIRESGSWSYVAFASKTRGWVPTESLEKIIPPAAPIAPKSDGKTA
jgi:hypothetical protein